MKVLIWFLCIFANALITTLCRYGGVILGGIPTAILFGITLWLARTLCKKWDKYKGNKPVKQKAEIKDSKPNITDSSEPILFCRKCGYKLVDGSGFCSQCGTKIIENEE